MTKTIIAGIITAVAICVLVLLCATIAKASDVVVEFRDMKIDNLTVQGFEMQKRGVVEIDAVGGKLEYSNRLFAYGWIIDAETRELVWTMQEDCDEIDRISDYLTECQSSVKLRPGKYEAYYYTGSPNMFFNGGNIEIRDLGEVIKLIGNIFSNRSQNRDTLFEKDDLEELSFRLTTETPFKLYTPVFIRPDNAIIYINQPESEEYIHQGFTLKRKMDVMVYAIGEYSDSYDVFVDGAWIIDASTRKKVWSMDKWNTDRAGGASKNRVFRETISLPPGNYIAYYATDDSHDADEWNAPPPADPMNYGLTIETENPDDMKYVSAFDDTRDEVTIVRLVRVHDNELKKAGFTLKKDSRIRIFALGERSYSDDQLADYGWITNAETMEKVWKMTADNTWYAGGAGKNCQFDGIIDLPAGNYMVYYRTDDSHAYGDWNDTPPFNKRSWGISLFGVGDDFNENSFVLVDDFGVRGKVLVDLTGLGDYEEVSRTFSLDKDTPIRIMALGEGKSRKMYDYGWIENKRTGEIVWEMTYRKTRYAGGAEKNRSVVANLVLPKGKYVAHFVTDDSHSFEGFNASPPDEPERWGMLITRK